MERGEKTNSQWLTRMEEREDREDEEMSDLPVHLMPFPSLLSSSLLCPLPGGQTGSVCVCICVDRCESEIEKLGLIRG